MTETTDAASQALSRRVIKRNEQKSKVENGRIDVDPDRVCPEQYPLVGNVGSDPELRFTAAGNAVTSFNVAYDVRERVTEPGKPPRWVSQGTMWVRVTCWRNGSSQLARGKNGNMRTRKRLSAL
jgi:hypothetical protein